MPYNRHIPVASMTDEQKEEARAEWRKKAKKKRENPEYKEIEKQRRNKTYRIKQRDLTEEQREAQRAKWREKARLQRKRNKERVNERQRDHYRNDPNGAEKQNARRIKREPWRGLSTAITRFERGDIGFSELNRLYSDRLALLHGRNVRQRPGANDTKNGHGQGERGLRGGSQNKRSDEDKD